ncbi:hypothetical protein ACK8GG_13450 [Micromonosporaceae bacterium DT55]|uniref:hypothetical protein n=1 Tax=Melissospora conviva TaxID=3388432 RepID=UPI003C225D79
MPDNNELALVRDALEVEARKWDQMAVTMAAAERTAESLILNPTAFWAGPKSLLKDQLSAAYDDVHQLVVTLLSDASIEFSEIAGALRTAAYRYDGTDQNQASDLIAIYGRYNNHP